MGYNPWRGGDTNHDAVDDADRDSEGNTNRHAHGNPDVPWPNADTDGHTDRECDTVGNAERGNRASQRQFRQCGSSSTVHTFTATNKSLVPAHIQKLTASLIGANPSAFVVSPDNCTGKTLDVKGKPTSKCTIGIAFAPTVPGPVNETLSITYDAVNPATATLTGIGIGPTAKIAPPTVSFAKTAPGATSAAKTVTISNTSKGASIKLSAPLA